MLSAFLKCIVALLCVPVLALGKSDAIAQKEDASPLLRVAPKVREASGTDADLVCVVVRTFWGHGSDGKSSLKSLIDSLKQIGRAHV